VDGHHDKKGTESLQEFLYQLFNTKLVNLEPVKRHCESFGTNQLIQKHQNNSDDRLSSLQNY